MKSNEFWVLMLVPSSLLLPSLHSLSRDLQNILGHDYKRKRGELRSTDLWIPYLLNAGDLSFGILIIWKLHQIHVSLEYFWIRDLTREFNKKYEVLLIYLFLLFLIFLVSEGLLFVSFFWTSFHSLSSLTLGISLGEGFYLPDPFELTFANTLLLSNAAICLGNAFISLEFSLEFLTFFSLFSFIHAWTFKFSISSFSVSYPIFPLYVYYLLFFSIFPLGLYLSIINFHFIFLRIDVL